METRIVNGVAIIDVYGEVALGATSDDLRDTVDELLATGHSAIVLNLAGTTHMDSSGLGTLIAAYGNAVRKGGLITLLSPPPRVSQSLEMTRSSTLFEISDSEADAVERIKTEGLKRSKEHLQQFEDEV